MRAPRSPRLLLFLLLTLAPVLAAQPADPDARLKWYEDMVMERLDPGAADRFLKDQTFQEQLKRRDPGSLNRLFQFSAGLKDLRSLIADHREPLTLRDALRIRLDKEALRTVWPGRWSPLGRPDRLIAWARDRFGVDKEKLLAEALWEWETLPPAHRAWLEGRGLGETGWRETPFWRRLELFSGRAEPVYKRLMEQVPKTPADLARMKERAGDVWGGLSDDERTILGNRLVQAEAAVGRLEALSRRAEVIADPALRARLEAARNARTLEDTLAGLARLFDGLGETDRVLDRTRPSVGAEGFSEGDRELLSGMLGRALLQEIAGTRTGEPLREFYRTHPIDLRITPQDTSNGLYRPGTGRIEFSEQRLLEWLRASGRKAPDLLTDGRPFQEVVMLLAPLFVHEGTHHMQDAWGEDARLPHWNGHAVEVEGLSKGALYTLEKSRQSRRYREFLARARGMSDLAESQASRAERLWRDPADFRRWIRAWLYSDFPSMETGAALFGGGFQVHRRAVEKEIRRRSGLPAPEREALEASGGTELPRTSTLEEFAAGLRSVKTSVLRNLVEGYEEAQTRAAAAYGKYRDRYRQSARLVAETVRQLRSGAYEPPAAPGGPGEPPAPPPSSDGG